MGLDTSNIMFYKPEVRVIGITTPVVDFIPDSEGIVSYTARVSAPHNQTNFETADGLLSYCAKEGHWSVFEMANAVLELKAPRDISRQVLRHKTAAFQEFSQRYAEVDPSMFVLREARLQDTKNRQNSIQMPDTLEGNLLREVWESKQKEVLQSCVEAYNWARSHNIAKECARVVLPEGLTMSNCYMNANMRTWLHYCGLRGGNGTQLEHVWLAKACKEVLKEHFPNLIKVLESKS